MGTTPLKLNDSAEGDLKQMTTAEENYLAYRAGLGLAAMDSSETSALSTLGDNNIGSHTDTKFDQAVGTHGVTLTTTSITTNLSSNGKP